MDARDYLRLPDQKWHLRHPEQNIHHSYSAINDKPPRPKKETPMGISPSHQFEDGMTPICSSCGVALCWDISKFEYEQDKEFWNNWRCEDCNPNYKGALKRFRQSKGREVIT